MTLTFDERLHERLYIHAGRRRISRFIEDLLRQHLPTEEPDAAYRQMAAEPQREREAHEWAEAILGDSVSDLE